jgi:TolB protein
VTPAVDGPACSGSSLSIGALGAHLVLDPFQGACRVPPVGRLGSWLLLLLLLALPGCGLLVPLGAASPRLAYIGTEGDLFTVRADGSDRRRLTRSGGSQDVATRSVHFWPSWSPDGRQIAAARTDVEERALVGAGLYAFAAAGGAERRLYAEDGNFPIYWSWAPDSRALALLSTEGNGVVLHVAATGPAAEREARSPSADGEPLVPRPRISEPQSARRALADPPPGPAREAPAPRELLAAYPLYFAWSPEATTLVAHVGGDGSGGRATGLYEIPIDGGASGEFDIGLGPSQYRAPAISRDGRTVVVAGGSTVNLGADVVVALQADVKEPRRLIEVDGPATFVLSPRGDRVAVSRFYPGSGRAEGVDVVDVASGAVERWVSSELLAFYWSPDGQRLAWLEVERAEGQLAWYVAEGPGQARRLTGFVPTDQLEATLGFFDQYAQSHALWSADSRYLAFAGWLGRPDGTAAQVWVVPADAKSPPRPVAEGLFATWSPTAG